MVKRKEYLFQFCIKTCETFFFQYPVLTKPKKFIQAIDLTFCLLHARFEISVIRFYGYIKNIEKIFVDIE